MEQQDERFGLRSDQESQIEAAGDDGDDGEAAGGPDAANEDAEAARGADAARGAEDAWEAEAVDDEEAAWEVEAAQDAEPAWEAEAAWQAEAAGNAEVVGEAGVWDAGEAAPDGALEPDGAEQRPATGEPRVDAALARLDELAGRPVTEHRAIFEDVHRRLRDVLGELDTREQNSEVQDALAGSERQARR
jgi:hypothetical protein